MCVTVKVLFLRHVYMMRQQWCLTVCYFLFPLALLLLGVGLYGVVPYVEYGVPTRLAKNLFFIAKRVEIVVYPGGDAERRMIERVQHVLHLKRASGYPPLTTPLIVTYTNDTQQMTDLLVSAKNNISFGVHFHQITSTKLEYTIRPQAFNIPSIYEVWGYYRTKERFPWPTYRGTLQRDSYIQVPISKTPGLMKLQVAIDKAYIQTYFAEIGKIKWHLVTFPYPNLNEVDTPLIRVFTHRFTLLCVQYSLIIAILFMISVFASYAVRDKMSGIRELLSVNGARRWMVNMSWLVSFCLAATILAIAEVGILKIPSRNGASIQYMSASVLTIVLVVYNLSSMCWVHFIANISTNDVFCVSMILTYWMISPILFQWIPPGHFILQACLAPLPNAGMVLIFNSFQEFDGAETIVDLKRLNTSPIHYWPIGDFLLIMLATSVLLVLLSAGVDLVKPGPYGRSKLLNVFTVKCKARDSQDDDDDGTTHESMFFDRIRKQDPIGLECVGICKFFGENKALDNVNLKILKNKVTVILGQNGAGKTSLISILCGIYSPTKGKLYAEGFDVFKGSNIKRLRKVLGYCPQSNVLLNDLTFQQNLILFSMLKGLSRHQAEKYCNKWTATFHIEHCRTRQVKYLSGGDKRKLSLAIALSGNPQYLLLDNPTSGLDAKSKRKFWDLILEKKGSCTVVLSTYNMDEADILGDRVVFLENGQVTAHLSSSLLKKKVDVGHIITCVVNEENVEKLVRFVTTSYASVRVLSQTSRSVTFWLLTDFKWKDIPRLLKHLESEFGENISSAVSYVTMDDIVVKFQDVQQKAEVEELRVQESDKIRSCCKSGHIIETLKKKTKWTLNRSLIMMLFSVMLLPLIGMGVGVFLTRRTLGRSGAWFDPADLKFSLDVYSGTLALISKTKSDINEALKSAMTKSGITYEEVDQNVTNSLDHDLARADLFKYRSRYVFAFVVTKKEVLGFYSRNALHSAPIAYSAIINALLQGKATIVTHNFPFTKKQEQLACAFNNSAVQLIFLTLLGPVLLLAGSYFIIFPHKERRTLFKQLQLMTGLLPAVYWVSNLVHDMIIFSMSCLLMIFIVTVMDIHFFWDFETSSIFVLVLLLYGLSTITFAYVWSFSRCSIPIVVTWYFIANTFPFFGFLILDIISSLSGRNFGTDGKYLFFLPWANLMNSLEKVTSWAEKSRRCYECQDLDSCIDILEGSLIGSLKVNLFAFLFSSIAYFAAIVAMDHGFGRRLKPIISRVLYGDITGGVCCPEIALEKAVVRDLDTDDTEYQPELVCDGLGKKYSSEITAVRDFTFVTDRGKLFGLLGPNGAGKTTIFGMLAGMISPTKGRVTIRGKWELGDCEYKYVRNIGYSPQFDGLLPGLSGRATLRLFGRLRGLKEDLVDSRVQKWLEALDMENVADRPCQEYSGGTRRKLNFAIAMIGSPSVVLLDEPITGIDPFVQRTIRKILMDKLRGQAIVLTTHNMVECETLCGRLAIIVNGDMKCIGSVTTLKKSLGKTCVLQVKFLENTTQAQLNVVQFKIEFRFAGHIDLRAKPPNHLVFNLATEKIRIYDAYAFMLMIKEENPVVDDFSITEAPLEEIFTMYTQRE